MECRGKGCTECELTGYTTNDSVEQRLELPILSLFNAGKVKFTWIGSEDPNSLVLGHGRPFYAEVLEPHIRKHTKIQSTIKKVDDGVSLNELKIINGRPTRESRFTVTVQSSLTLNKRLTKKDVQKLQETFKETFVKMMPAHKNSSTTKKIHSLIVESTKGHNLKIKMECDGGLSIRRFLTGEGKEIEPNMAEILNREITLDEEKPFDILEVNLTENL